MKSVQTILIILLLVSISTFAQQANEILSNSTWQVEQEVMSGVVNQHTNLPKGTIISFQADGTWSSSSPFVAQATTGTWKLSAKQQLVLISNTNKAVARFSIITSTERILILKQQKGLAKRTIQCKAADRAKIIKTLPLVVTL